MKNSVNLYRTLRRYYKDYIRSYNHQIKLFNYQIIDKPNYSVLANK